jgi:hypothetical protein
MVGFDDTEDVFMGNAIFVKSSWLNLKLMKATTSQRNDWKSHILRSTKKHYRERQETKGD